MPSDVLQEQHNADPSPIVVKEILSIVVTFK